MNLPGIQWSSGEAAAVNEWLNSPLGRKWLGVLLTLRPKVDLRSTESAALTGAFHTGYEYFFDQIALTRMPQVDESPATKAIDMTRD